MERRRLSGLVLGTLVGAVLVATGFVAVASFAKLGERAAAAAGPVGMDVPFSDIAGSAAAIATPGFPIVADAGVRTQNFLKLLGDVVENSLKTAGKVAAKNALKRYLGDLAKGTAEWIANGGRGQTPLFEYKSFYSYLADEREVATVTFLDGLANDFFGVDVCDPKLGAKLVIHYSQMPSTRLDKAACSLQQIKDNWAELLPNNPAFLEKFSVALEPDQNDLGIALTLRKKLLVERETQANAAVLERLESLGLKPLKDLAGNIITPASAVGEQIRQTLGLAALSESSFIGDPVADAVSIFVNTLGGRLQQKWLKGGFVNIADVFNRAGGSGGLFGGAGRYSVAEPRFAALAAIEFSSAGTVDVVSELTNCSDPAQPGYGNQCVLDAQFGQAVQQRLTVREAMERGLLRGEWAFGYLADGSEPRYGTGYPYSAMVIMRTKRIVPVGWELAAQAAKAFDAGVTLEHVVHCYEDPAAADDGTRPLDCQVNGINPFYRLVDPNWVLKVPTTYCARRGSSAELLTEQYICNQDTNQDGAVDCVNLDSTQQMGREDTMILEPDGRDDYYRLLQRASYCADEQSCIAENADGTCRAYGYCFEEKQVFSLGDNACPSQFASCIGVTTPSGRQAAYIQDSLQTCASGAAGCQWYSTRRAGGSWSSAPANRIYLNSEAATCGPDDVGCRRLLRFGQGTNLVPNGGFEQYDRHAPSAAGDPDNFFINGGAARGQAFTNAAEVNEGQVSFHLTASGDISVLTETGGEVAGRTFTASVASKGCTVGSLSLLDGDGGAVGVPADLEITGPDVDNSQWHTATVTGTTQAPGTSLTVQVSGLNVSADADCYLDALAVTEGAARATLAYGAGRSVHVSSRATQCSQDDVGCQAFVPTSGDPTVFGRITANDYCPAQCVGYQNYSPLINTFEVREGIPAPANSNFIPSTARSCSAVDVGCSEFTSLAEVPEGGERLAYFSQVQQCVADGAANVGTYYTWEGSDTDGYQLRVWQLLRTNLAPDLTPCTNLSLSDSPVCEDVAASGLPHSQAICDPALGDPDCREVFDSNANSHFVLWSRVVQSTTDCQQYRRTGGAGSIYNISPRLARRCPAAANGCRQYRGATGGNTRTVLLADFESPSAAGWGGTRVALTTEALQVGGHSLLALGASGSVTLRRTEAVAMRPGHEYLLTVWVKGSDRDIPAGNVTLRNGLRGLLGRLGATSASAQPAAVNLQFNAGPTPIGGEWQMLQLGPVSTTTLASTMTFDVTLALAPGLRSAYFDNIQLKEVTSDTFVVQNSWDTPQACDNPPGLPNGIDTNPRTEPGAMVGCSRYRVAGRQVTLRSFNRLCAERNVGCQAFMDTANSVSPFAQRFNATCSLGSPAPTPTVCNTPDGYQRCVVGAGSSSCRYTQTANYGTDFVTLPSDPEDQVMVSGDSIAYLVDNPAAYCSAEIAGCTLLGMPRINKQLWTGTGEAPAGSIVSWQDVYRVANPDQFSRSLCSADQLWCASHRVAGGGTITFRDPQGSLAGESRTCEYRTGVQVGTQLVTGWFRTGSDDGCRGLADYSLPLNGAPGYDRFAGQCPAQYSGCTNYRNPQPSATGGERDNYFLKSSVDSSSCNGLVDVAGGCMLFKDPAQPALYSSLYSYPPNRLPGQAPVATSTLDSNVILKVRRDRSCRQWYSCGSSVAVPGSSTGQRVCTSLTSCTQLDPATNQCANSGGASFPVGTVFANEFTFSSPADSRQWRNLAGYTVPGIQFPAPIGLVSRGFTPYSSMEQIGLSATVSNGGFDDVADSLITADGVDWHSCDSGTAAVPATRACVYATSPSKVREGRASLRLTTTLNATTTLQHGTVALAPGSTYAVSVQLNTVDMLAGSVALEVLDSAGDVQLQLQQVPGQGWQTLLGQFVANSSITLRLAATADASGSVYVDEVKVEPVLQVNAEPRYVGQQCRVYPRGDSPSCRYTQVDGEYRGITGYCVQPDPRNPSRCIQWWPVDVVAGQSFDVFGETISLTGRTPLRYCTEAVDSADDAGDYWRETWLLANDGGETAGTLRYHSTTTDGDSDAWEWGIHWSQISGFYIRRRDGSGEYVPEARFLGELKRQTFSDSRGSVDNFGFYSGQYHAGNYHSLFIGVNPNTGFVESYRAWADDDTGGDGEHVTMNVYFILKEQCAVVAEVRAGDLHAAWYDTFNNSSDVNGGDVTLRAGDDAAPYGALSPNVSDDLVNEVCDRYVLNNGSAISFGCALPVGNFPLSGGAQAERAGTPLSCPSGSCGTPQCSKDRTNRCSTQPQIDACLAADPVNPDAINYCIGRPVDMVTPPPAQPNGNRVGGARRLSNLFARSYFTWAMNSASRWYIRFDCLNDAAIQARIVAAGDGVDPISGCWDRRKVLSTPDSSPTTLRPRVPEITINGQPSDTPEIMANEGDTVELRFSSLLNPERLPLRFILVDWGDGERTVTSRLSINHQPAVATGHLLTHTYTTRPTTTCGTDFCATVKVQIEDNWGFCNGVASAATYNISSTNQSLNQSNPGCFIGNLTDSLRWTRATTTLRFSTADDVDG